MPTPQCFTILVLGGAGYIGSHMVAELVQQGHAVLVLDDLSSGHRDLVEEAIFVQGSCGDPLILNKIFTSHPIDAVMHFAAHIEVGESIDDPAKYYNNNVTATLNVLNVMRTFDIRYFIFSSSAAIFGEPTMDLITSDAPKAPINPYGRSKWIVEQILA